MPKRKKPNDDEPKWDYWKAVEGRDVNVPIELPPKPTYAELEETLRRSQVLLGEKLMECERMRAEIRRLREEPC